MIITDKRKLRKIAQHWKNCGLKNYEVLAANKIDDRYRVLSVRKEPSEYGGGDYAVHTWNGECAYWGCYDLDESLALRLLADGDNYNDAVEEVEGYLREAVRGWYCNADQEYFGLDDEEFIKAVCENTGMNEKIYREIMGL